MNGNIISMVIGAVIALVGTAVTLGTYQAASGGGQFVVAWGAILFGALQFLSGLIRHLRSN